ncbi:MAG: hypothetical protein ABSF91_08230 [Bacteroidota bacterium]
MANRKELALRKLSEISDGQMKEAIEQLSLHVKARLRLGSPMDRTKWGAHTEASLGVDPVAYYVGETIKRLYDPNGWDWKFETFTLAEQLIRIANKIISDKVTQYKLKKETSPIRLDKDIADVYDLPEIQDEDEEVFERVRELAYEVSKDDDSLAYFALRYFEDADFSTIASELGITIDEVYVLKRKLVRRLVSRKDELNNSK